MGHHGTWHQQMPQKNQQACAHRDFDLLGGKAHERGAVQRAVDRRRRSLPQGGHAACAAGNGLLSVEGKHTGGDCATVRGPGPAYLH